ncbi:hypothetical protein CH247_11080 [Rhodococcus sp. 06-156-3b]|nr:hypothetical protein CH247_11080 [Rhodococcus sp. 06-156-3b]
MRARPSTGGDDDTPVAFAKRWVDEFEALRITGRSKRTLSKWRKAGLIRRRKRGGVHVYEVEELNAAKADSERRAIEYRFTPGQPGGPGRRPHPARPRIAELLAQEVPMTDIARDCGCSVGLVKAVRKEL